MAGLPYGNPLPPDFEDGKELTAAAFNAVKNYWVTDELPEDAVDGDVVFVIGDEPVGDSGELPGIGGWATIKEVTGNPTRYEYPAGNPEWVAFEWTADGTLTTTDGMLDVLLVSGGGSTNAAGSVTPGGGAIIHGLEKVTGNAHTITIGLGGRDKAAYQGLPTIVGNLNTGPSYDNRAFGTQLGVAGHDYYKGMVSGITGTDIMYGHADMATVTPNRGEAPVRLSGQNGGTGVVIVRVPAANDNTKGAGSTPASVVAAVDQAKETVKQTIKRNRRNR